MKTSAQIALSWNALRAHRLRSALTVLGIAIGICAVVLLTGVGAGIQRFVLAEFTQFGTHLIGITPGKTQTHGMSVSVIGTVRPLTIADGEALRALGDVRGVVPVVQGNAEVEFGGRSRRVMVIGTGSQAPSVWRFRPALGRFLPADDPQGARSFTVLGAKVVEELFAGTNPLGEKVRIGGESFRVLGAMEHKGQVLGFDLDDAIYLPAARALEMFNREGLMEVDVLYGEQTDVPALVAGIRKILTARHGHEDFTITTQEQMLEVLGSVLDVLTFAVGALGGISLLVGGIGIATIMIISVTERTAEIGLLRALGARRRQILALFLGEALLLGLLGGLCGLVAGAVIVMLLKMTVPALPVAVPLHFVALALSVSLLIGFFAGLLPARRAARLDPVEALRAE